MEGRPGADHPEGDALRGNNDNNNNSHYNYATIHNNNNNELLMKMVQRKLNVVWFGVCSKDFYVRLQVCQRFHCQNENYKASP